MNAVKVQIIGGAREAATALRSFHAERILPTNYSIIPGEINGSMYLTITFQHVSAPQPNVSSKNPQSLLERTQCVLNVTDVGFSARRHLRMIIDPSHVNAPYFRKTMQELGGHEQGKNNNKLKLTADGETLERILSYCRGTPDLVARAKVNAPFTTAVTDVPLPLQKDVTKSPEFAPEAVRHVLKIACWPELEHDAQIIEILDHYGFEVTSIGSHARLNTEGEVQELTIMMHGGSTETLRRSLAEISPLGGVIHVDRAEENTASQYMQVVFPFYQSREIQPLLSRHHGLHFRGLMTNNGQLVTTGTMPLFEIARVRKELADAGIDHRPNSVILPTYGNPVRPPENHWPTEDTEFWDTYQALLRRDLDTFVQQRNTA